MSSSRPPGVNLFGYVFAEHGVGEASRLLIECVREAGLDFAVVPYRATACRQEAAPDLLGAAHPVYDVNLIVVNADSLPEFVELVGPQALEGRYNIGVWAWEIETLPPKLADSARFLDEIWAISRFTADAIARAVTCPVFPLPLPSVRRQAEKRTRAELGLSDEYLFLFCFDFNSLFERKNPLGLIEAYRRAFPPGHGGTQLVIKTLNGQEFSEDLERLNAAALDRRDILIVDGYLPAEEQSALMGACDAYVSLHRSEGFGLTLLEAMALGKPVIGTAYSGNLDFMTAENSYLVPYRMVDVPSGCGPYPATSQWAEPDVGVTASLMRRVFVEREEARLKAEKARRDVQRLHTPEARSRLIVDRLQAIRAQANGHPARVARNRGLPRRDLPGPAGNDATGQAGRPHVGFSTVKELLAARLVRFDPGQVLLGLCCGQLDGGMLERGGGASVWGWAYDPRTLTPASAVLLILNGEQIAIRIPVASLRPDVGTFLKTPALAATGWSLYVPPRLLAEDRNVFTAYAVLPDGRLGALRTGRRSEVVLRRRRNLLARLRSLA